MARILIGNVKGRPGRDGTPGRKGDTGDRGTSFVTRGTWVANTQYLKTAQVIDVVYYKGSSYYCKQTNYRSTPPDQDTAYWGLICGGIERVVGRITLNAMDFSASSLSDLYVATYTFPSGTFPSGVLADMRVSPMVKLTNGVQLGAITNDTVKIYAERLSGLNGIEVDVYYETITPTVVSNS